MEPFSPRCRCALGRGKSCCPCSCFPSLCPLYWPWCAPPPLFSPRTSRRSSGSCCLSPTMWCLLLHVSSYLKRCCRRNETRLPHPRCFDGGSAQLWPVSGASRGSHGADHRGSAADLVLSCFLLLDSFLAIYD